MIKLPFATSFYFQKLDHTDGGETHVKHEINKR